MRPWLDWRTIRTANYRFYFPPELEAWTRDAAARVESVDSVLTALIGYSTPKPVHVVVDDPFGVANGFALPFLDRPVSGWWAIPPDPRSDIGNFRSWSELLSVHELAHLTHLTRPSRNPFLRFLWSLPAFQFGPIVRKGSRWLWEGYATTVEGRVTGSGRPNNVWRPAILRQWAIEGRLPSYGELSSLNGFRGGEFAYMSGSAFLEWLAQREGDSSLVHLWRRMTAREDRTFDAAFTGVFGESPGVLYERHVAELTHDALSVRAEFLNAGGLVEGELIQRLAWDTGDPALSPDGSRVAIVLRERDRPARIVVWNTAPEPQDTVAARKVREALAKDPEDVPDRTFFPRPKKAHKTLHAKNGLSYQEPRWFADGRRILANRWTPRSDGTLKSDLYIWDTEGGSVRRVTHGASVLNADPSPDGREAVAARCAVGHCDVARVDLTSGKVTTLLEGDLRRSYYRPRYSRSGDRFVASVSDSGRWRLVVADRDGRHARYVDPADGANRYDAQWLGSGDTLVVVSERGGIPNLELVDVGSARVRALTRVTGAAVGPDVDPRDGSIWFLSLHSRGFDVRKVTRATPTADSALVVSSDRFGFAGLQSATGMQLHEAPVSASRGYGAGFEPREHRLFFPSGYSSAGGGALVATLFSGDIVGRLSATANAAYRRKEGWEGASLRLALRRTRSTIELSGHGFVQQPSRSPYAQLGADSLDAQSVQGLLAISRARQGDGWRIRTRLGGGVGELRPRLGASLTRAQGFGEIELQLEQRKGSTGFAQRFRVHGTHGRSREDYQRFFGLLELGTAGRDAFPVTLTGAVGRIVGTPHPYEMFTVGGLLSPVTDSSLMTQRYDLPAYPAAIATGKALLGWRAAIPWMGWTAFYEGASTAVEIDKMRKWYRAVGFDFSAAIPPTPVAFAPRAQTREGIAYTLDAPFKKRLRAFVEIRLEP